MTEVLVTHPRFSIYGEIHNQIDNDIYKEIFASFAKDEIVMCEHTTFQPFLDMEQKAIEKVGFSRLLNKMNGSEWIYLKCLSEQKPVIGVDVRAEKGFPLAVEETEFLTNGVSDPVQCLTFVKNVLTNAIQYKESYAKYPEIKEMYGGLTRQIMECYQQLRRIFSGDDEDECNVIQKTSVSLKRLAGLFVDVHIMDLLTECLKNGDGPHISIFVGARHATTLYKVLSSSYELSYEITEKCKEIVGM
jgi:hypothetical protein